MRALLMAVSLIVAPGDSAVTPGEFVIEHPTLINLGFEWHVDGDANRNASVDVSFRKQGETAWRKGMPLARLHGEQVFQRNVFNLITPNMFAGSILDLEPGTAYEARFVMTDPDGVTGPAANATKIVTVRTRPEPMPATGGKTYHVYPTKWQGPKTEPAFEGIMCAYNYWCGAGDTAPGGRPRVKAGDTILVHAGTYAYQLDAKDLATVQRLYAAEDFDFRLRPGSAAVDRGIELPNITDGFTGQAPDLGALEVGRPVPVYGPRPR